MTQGAWIRPKHAPKKPSRPVEQTLTPLLSYFSCNTHTHNVHTHNLSKPKVANMTPQRLLLPPPPPEQTHMATASAGSKVKPKKPRSQPREAIEVIVHDEYEDEDVFAPEDVHVAQRWSRHDVASRSGRDKPAPAPRRPLVMETRGLRPNGRGFGQHELRSARPTERRAPTAWRDASRERSRWDYAVTPSPMLV